MKPETQELLPCPFCGAISFYKHNDCLIKHETTCYLFDFWRIQNVGRWNTRANTIPLNVAEKMFEALDSLIPPIPADSECRCETCMSFLKGREALKLAQQHNLGKEKG